MKNKKLVKAFKFGVGVLSATVICFTGIEQGYAASEQSQREVMSVEENNILGEVTASDAGIRGSHGHKWLDVGEKTSISKPNSNHCYVKTVKVTQRCTICNEKQILTKYRLERHHTFDKKGKCTYCHYKKK